MIVAALLGVYGCGGSGSSSGGGGTQMDQIMWPSRGGGETSQLPPAVETGRVVFQSQSGESCCVAVDPSLLSGSGARGLAILNDLPVGPATVTVSGFTTDFAPAVPGIVDTCSTVPANAAMPCDPMRVAAPAFESAAIPVTILAGVQTNLGDVPMDALPFLFDFVPAQGTDAPAPVQFALTVVDAATNIRRDSVELEVSFPAPEQPGATASPFRVLSKRVTLNLSPCADGTNQPCSPQGTLQLAGFSATGTAPELPEGQVEAHITAENLGNPPRDLDFRYSFNVLATPTATATATPTAAETSALSARDDVTAPALEGAAPSAPGGGAERTTDGAQNSSIGVDAPGAHAEIPPTPTATPTPGGTT